MPLGRSRWSLATEVLGSWAPLQKFRARSLLPTFRGVSPCVLWHRRLPFLPNPRRFPLLWPSFCWGAAGTLLKVFLHQAPPRLPSQFSPSRSSPGLRDPSRLLTRCKKRSCNVASKTPCSKQRSLRVTKFTSFTEFPPFCKLSGKTLEGF